MTEVAVSPIQQRLIDWSEPVTESGCWIWTHSTNRKGYGELRSGSKNLKAHRVSYDAFIGPIPAGLHVLHRCDVPGCVNPAHLFVGSNKDNVADKMRKGRLPSQKGIKNPNAKLTQQQVREIRATLEYQHMLAMKYSVGQSTIADIKLRKTWSDLD